MLNQSPVVSRMYSTSSLAYRSSPAIATPEARQAAFLQHDHVRLYAPDIADRLTAAGFTVDVLRPRAMLGDDAVRRARLLESDWAFLCR